MRFKLLMFITYFLKRDEFETNVDVSLRYFNR